MIALGVLFSSGWKLDDVLDLSMDQLFTVINCVVAHKMQVFTMVGETVVTALGGKPKKIKNKKKVSPENEEADLLRMIQTAGFSIDNKTAPSGSDKTKK